MSEREKLRFYEIAHGSFRESVTILELGEAGNEELDRIADQLGGSLFQLTRALSFRIIGKK